MTNAGEGCGVESLARSQAQAAYALAGAPDALLCIADTWFGTSHYEWAYVAYRLFLHRFGTEVSEATRRRVEHDLEMVGKRTELVDLIVDEPGFRIEIDGWEFDRPSPIARRIRVSRGVNSVRASRGSCEKKELIDTTKGRVVIELAGRDAGTR
jgi:hypothetical protein